MEQYINKNAIVAEIEKRKNESWLGSYTKEKGIVFDITNEILSFLDTLEIKEINLEDNIKENLAQKYINYIVKKHNIDPDSKEGQLIYYAYIHGMNQCLSQLKAQKGE